MSNTAYQIARPAQRNTSVVFASPHSGRGYTAAFMGQVDLDAMLIRSSEDAFVDQLYAAAPDFGAPLIRAIAPRAFVDLNRGPDEFDPALIKDIFRKPQNPRIASGLGVIPRVVANGRHIYRGKITLAQAHDRIANYWRPYHDQLQTLMDESNRAYGQSILIDCHSMPHEALSTMTSPNTTLPDIVLGDRFGKTAAPQIMDQVEQAFVSAGFRVARNAPFAGAYIVQRYGHPARSQHAIQVEIDRGIYMNEKTLTLNPDFAHIQAVISGVIAQIAEIGMPADQRIAAE
ncbi:N-formylglutamate amidohydrolase [Yoonia sp. I 8.24]|uniref:N-formylglutamate amidohydrolase n=1 Tax=Yoonia sp. I 8.24 TaxID=1537229 RepID=UPI001EE0C291|nr:N-formylglutamate amidohydrolase [Yoonia sp. I 8.24]MCG3269161.1 N-formylglutamate amidohydrolase [Yoonia sp. I 8.24]